MWLSASYEFASPYSLRAPLSSSNSAAALPAPGPGTVRLALVRTCIELFGLEFVRDELFPVIRSAAVCVSPPQMVALSYQRLRAYKLNPKGLGASRTRESIIYREYAHAEGPLTVYIDALPDCETLIREAMRAIGYWGKNESLAYCTSIANTPPTVGEYGVLLRDIHEPTRLGGYYTSLVTELKDGVPWEEVIPIRHSGRKDAIRVELQVWPMIVSERGRRGTVLLRRSLNIGNQNATA